MSAVEAKPLVAGHSVIFCLENKPQKGVVREVREGEVVVSHGGVDQVVDKDRLQTLQEYFQERINRGEYISWEQGVGYQQVNSACIHCQVDEKFFNHKVGEHMEPVPLEDLSL